MQSQRARIRTIVRFAVSFGLVSCSRTTVAPQVADAVLSDSQPREFVAIDSFRLPSGQHDILVGTWQNGRIALFDRVSGRIWASSGKQQVLQPIGRTGSGPGEYRSVLNMRWSRGSLLVVDPLNRRLLTFESNGEPGATYPVAGGAYRILNADTVAMLVSGRFLRDALLDTVDVVERIGANGSRSRHLALPFPTDPAGRRFSSFHASRCGQETFAAVRRDSSVVWFARERTLAVNRVLRIPIRLSPPDPSQPRSKSDDPARFRFTSLMGDETSCVVLSVIDRDGDSPSLELLRINPDSVTVRRIRVPVRLPLSVERDTLYSLDAETKPAYARLLILPLNR